MTKINLLPWREQARQARKMQLIYLLVSAVALAFVAVFILHLYYNMLIKHQNARNTFLQTQISREQGLISELSKKRKEQTLIDTELQFIFNLRERSYQAVRMLDELPRLAPDGVSFYKIVRTQKAIAIFGKAQSNLEVTLFMKNIARSVVFKQPDLTMMTGKASEQGEELLFQVSVEPEDLKRT